MGDFTKIGLRNFMQHQYTAVIDDFTPAATPTDIAFFAMQNETQRRIARVQRITVYGTATTAAPYPIWLYRSTDAGGYATAPVAETKFSTLGAFQVNDTAAGYLAKITANPATKSGSRTLAGKQSIMLGDATHACVPAVFDFSSEKGGGLNVRSLSQWLVLAAAATETTPGAALPAGLKLTIVVEWVEEVVPRVIFVGDSTTSEASQLFVTLMNAGDIANSMDIRNHGNNGATIQDVQNNQNGVIFPLASTIAAAPDIVVMSLGINNVRTGSVTTAQLIALLQGFIIALKAALPDVIIILREPNSITADGSTYVTLTGQFAGLTRAQAGQAATDMLHDAYLALRSFAGVSDLFETQADIFGRASLPLAQMPLMTDELHPNGRGRMLVARKAATSIMKWVPSIPLQQ